MRQGSLTLTPKGKQAIENYKEGRYDEANLSELEFGLLVYAQSKQWQGIPIHDSLKQYGTEGTAALEELLETGKLQYRTGPFGSYRGGMPPHEYLGQEVEEH